jgi:hypothetical protein
MIRSLHENGGSSGATNIAYLHDAGAAFELRFARGVAFLISDANLARKAADRVPGNTHMSTPGPRITQQYKELLAHIERAKIQITLNKKGERKGVRLSATAPEALINVTMTDLVPRQATFALWTIFRSRGLLVLRFRQAM